jgi:galactokinase
MTTADPAERLDLAPELRMASYAFREEFGRPAATIGRVLGRVTLLADGPLRLTVATPWGAIAAAGPASDDVIEITRMQRPGERERLTVGDAIAGLGPRWAGTGLRSARAGARLLISCELPEGVGVGVGDATEAAIARCLGDHRAADHRAADHRAADHRAADHRAADLGAADLGAADLGAADLRQGTAAACAMLGAQPLPFDLAAAGLRLMIIDTGIRGAPLSTPAEDSPVAVAARALAVGDLIALARLLTGAHDALACHDAQHGAVAAALRAGALGARASTDGTGRPVCALVPASRLADVRAAVRFWFTRNGFRPPRFLTFTAASGSFTSASGSFTSAPGSFTSAPGLRHLRGHWQEQDQSPG